MCQAPVVSQSLITHLPSQPPMEKSLMAKIVSFIKTEIKQTIKRINETKNWLFEKINKIDKLLARLTKKKKEKGPK